MPSAYLVISLNKARTKEDDAREFQEAIASFNESRHPLYGGSLPQGYF